MSPAADRVQREVVSFVRRSARMNASQQRAWDSLQHWIVPVPARVMSTSIAADAVVDWPAVFGRRAPLIVEIGGGTGHAIAAHAAAHPEVDHVVFEVHQPSVASTLSRLQRAGVDNVRVVLANGVEGLERLFGEGSLAEVWTFFPDPWHKARHHKRRLVTPEFAGLVASRLAPGGTWRLATDWAEYADWMLAVLDEEPRLANPHPGFSPRWDGRPSTKFEAKGLAAGREVFDITYRRIG